MTEQLHNEQNPPGYEHLKDGVKPIMTCAGHFSQFVDDPGETVALSTLLENVRKTEQDPNIFNLRFYGEEDYFKKNQILNGGRRSYVISPIDSRNKICKDYTDCPGIAVAGRRKDTREEVSFLSHQNPGYFLRTKEEKERFLADLKSRLREMKEICEPGTIDAVLFAGRDNDKNPASKFRHNTDTKEPFRTEHDEYIESIELLQNLIKDELGFMPAIPIEPKKTYEEEVFYNTLHRRLYIIHPKKDWQ